MGISICYFEETKLHGGNISESDAAKWLSCAQKAVDTATTELQKGHTYMALSQAQEYNGLYRESIANLLTSSEHFLNDEVTSKQDRSVGVVGVCMAGLNTLKYLHDTDTAKQIFQKALALATKENAGDHNKAAALAGLTLAALTEGNKQEANRILQSAIQYDKGTAYAIVGNWSKQLGIELSPKTNSSQAYANSSNMLNENPEDNPRQWAKNSEREIIQQKRREIYERTGIDYAQYIPAWR